METNTELRTKSHALQQVIGISRVTAAVLLAYLPELGTVNRQRIAALVGLAPYDNSSGTTDGRKRRRGGRPHVLEALYYPVLTAIRCSEEIGTFYRRLVANGKLTSVARVACARKLLVHLNTVLAQHVPETPAPTQSA